MSTAEESFFVSLREVADLDRARLPDLGVPPNADGEASFGAPAPRLEGVRGLDGFSVKTVILGARKISSY